MVWLYRISIRFPKAVMLVAALLTLAVAPGMLRLELRTDGHALVPVDAPEIKLDRQVRDQFGTEDPVVLLIKSDNTHGIFNTATLKLVQNLTDAFRDIDGIRPADVFSLATEHGHRVKQGTLRFRRFLEPMPITRRELDTLREDLRQIRLYTGTLVSYDETATAIMVGVPADRDRIGLCKTIRELVDAQGDIPDETHVIGAPVAEALLGTHLLEDLGVPSALLGHRTWDRGSEDGWRWPSTPYEFRQFLGQRIGLVPVAIAVMTLVFVVCFRSIPAAILPLTEVGACLVAVFGLMGWVGVPVYLTIAVLPVILTAMGVADEIHIFMRYRDLLREETDRQSIDVVRATMDEMWIPVVKTSVTTAVGFLSFALSPIGPVQAFGVFTAVGIIFCMLWSLTVIPALLTVVSPRWFVGRKRSTGGERVALFSRIFSWGGRAVVRCRYLVVLLAVGVVVFASSGVRRIVVQDSWIDGFAPGSEFYKTTRYFNEQFLGMHILLVRVNAPGEVVAGNITVAAFDDNKITIPWESDDDPQKLITKQIVFDVTERGAQPRLPSRRGRPRDTWRSRIERVRRAGDTLVITTARKHGWAKPMLGLVGPETVKYEISPQPFAHAQPVQRISELEDFIAKHRQQTVGGVIGTADYLETTNLMSQGLKQEARSIPAEPERIHWLWRQYERIRGEDRRAQIVDEHYGRSLVTVFMKDANFVGTKTLMDDIRSFEKENLTPHEIELDFAGDVAVSQTLIDAIVSTQTRSLLASLVGILVLTAILGRSPVWGILCVLPCALAVLVNFAMMGWVGMPLGVATSMFAGMTLGIGVDYAIHLLERQRRARRQGLSVEEAINDAVQATGPAILVDALAVALGFGILMLSQVPANARLGGLVMLSIINCFVATMVLLPALLRILSRREKTPAQGSSHAAGTSAGMLSDVGA
ncbi:MAG: MMPL family transporter [Phycisphaerales bacterium]|nr:MAG: MMPL family transporter [Phycisphaerales bacterium]